METEFVLVRNGNTSGRDKYKSIDNENFEIYIPHILSRDDDGCPRYRFKFLITPIIEKWEIIHNVYNTWENETRHLHATIQSILDIPIEESRIFLCLDRNAIESVEDEIGEFEEGSIITPSDIFTNNYYIRFNRISEIMGKIDIFCGKEDFDSPEGDGKRTEFDINYQKENWYPLENGELPARDSQLGTALLDEVRDWKSFPKTTRLGFRGPMIPIEKIDEIKIKY
jgi:hypothetical protein